MAFAADRHRRTEAGRWRDWSAAAARPEIGHALWELYRRLDEAIAARGPTCWASGKCCSFDDYGHRLYVTGLEIAWFLREVSSEASSSTGRSDRSVEGEDLPGGGLRLPQIAERSGACPYQVGGRCSTHRIRPLGCRVFFCQAGTEAWQQDLYEAYLKELIGLHKRHGLEYQYMDWIAGLDAAAQGLSSPSTG